MNFKDFDFMGLLILCTLLFGVFILVYPRLFHSSIESHKEIKNNDKNLHSKPESKWSDAGKIEFIAGVASILLSFNYLFATEPPSDSGRLGFLIQYIFKISGNFGIFLGFVTVGLLMIIHSLNLKNK